MSTDSTSHPPASPATRIMLRPLGSPLPLGFFAFAIGTVLFASMELGWVGPVERGMLALVVLSFVAPLESVAAVFAFLARDAGAATSLGLFAAGWVTTALFLLKFVPGETSGVYGIFLLMDGLAIGSVAVIAISGKPLLGALLGLAAVRFVLAASVQFGAGRAVEFAAGAVGLGLGAVGLYGGLALLMEDVRQRTILPIFRTGRSRQALEGNLDEQLGGIQREAGVRQKL